MSEPPPLLVDALVDDKEIDDDALLYRRVSWSHIGGRSACGPGQVAKLSGNVFRDYPAEAARALGYPAPCMSVALSTVLAAQGRDPEVVLEEFPQYGLARIRVGDLRRLERADGTPCPQGIMASPTLAEPWHAVVFDLSATERTKSVAKRFMLIAEWQVPLVG